MSMTGLSVGDSVNYKINTKYSTYNEERFGLLVGGEGVPANDLKCEISIKVYIKNKCNSCVSL